MFGLGVDPQDCNLAIAKRVRFADVVADPVRFRSQCVKFRAVANGSVAFADARTARQAVDGKAARVGLYHREMAADFPRRPRLVQLAGLVGDCAALWAEAEYVGGYCHMKERGAFLIVGEVRQP